MPININPFIWIYFAALTSCVASTGRSQLMGEPSLPPAPVAKKSFLQTGTPYQPQQDSKTYERPPEGFRPIFTQMVARHGSRGLSGLGSDLVVANMWQKAAEDGALTPLGQHLGPDVESLMKANFLLGYGVAGISKPGYGNETEIGQKEHTQLAQAVLNRLPDLFTIVKDDSSTERKRILVTTSGIPRAVDSSGFFVRSLTQNRPDLKELLEYPPSPTGYPNGAPIVQPAGTNRFLLYFHKLNKNMDLVTNPTDPMYTTYNLSQSYQNYLKKDPDLTFKQNILRNDPMAKIAARQILETLFTHEFVDKIDQGTYSFASVGTRTFSNAQYKITLAGDGSETIASLVDAAGELYSLYIMAPSIFKEAKVDFSPYLPPSAAQYLASLNDGIDFYQKGPGIIEKQGITYHMAQSLLDNFFSEVDEVIANRQPYLAHFRFCHAEIIIPFVTILHLKTMSEELPLNKTYSYSTSSWRGDIVAPMAANIQWDIVTNEQKRTLVKMYHNEKEVDFMPQCAAARYQQHSFYYDYQKLRACYQRRVTTQVNYQHP